MRVIGSPTALRQIGQVYDYLVEFNPVAARHVVLALVESGDRLADFPHTGRTVVGTAMRELVVVPPYIIRYRIGRDAVRILRVRHGSRRPTRS